MTIGGHTDATGGLPLWAVGRVAIAAIGGHRPGGSPETIAGPEQQSVAGSRISVFQIARRMKQGGGTDRTWTSGGSGPSVENKKAQPLQMVRL